MKYTKPSLTYEQQADQLLSRGLQADKTQLITRLKAVSYYRLSTYLFPFRHSDNSFVEGTTLGTVWGRYTFDRQLRLLVMDVIERIEVAIRTELVYMHVDQFGPFGYLNQSSFPNISSTEHTKLLKKIDEEYQRSHETFVIHFRQKYGDQHSALPLWMAIELLTFGTLLTMFRGSPKPMKQNLAQSYGVADTVLESWLQALNVIRNVCAHHGRLWDRNISVRPLIPRCNKHPHWHEPVPIPNSRIFGILSVLKYCLGRVAPQSKWKNRVIELLKDYPDVPLVSMGFIKNWQEHKIWKL